MSNGETLVTFSKGDNFLHGLVSYEYIDDDIFLEALESASGEELNAQNSLGRTPLMLATQCCYFFGIRSLIEVGANINCPDYKFRTCLHYAVLLDTYALETCQLLLSGGADVNREDVDGYSPLHLASALGDMETCELFISFGANVNNLNLAGDTPICLSIREGHLEVTELLLTMGANPNISDSTGRMPAEVAKLHGYKILSAALALKAAECPRINSRGEIHQKRLKIEERKQAMSLSLEKQEVSLHRTGSSVQSKLEALRLKLRYGFGHGNLIDNKNREEWMSSDTQDSRPFGPDDADAVRDGSSHSMPPLPASPPLFEKKSKPLTPPGIPPRPRFPMLLSPPKPVRRGDSAPSHIEASPASEAASSPIPTALLNTNSPPSASYKRTAGVATGNIPAQIQNKFLVKKHIPPPGVPTMHSTSSHTPKHEISVPPSSPVNTAESPATNYQRSSTSSNSLVFSSSTPLSYNGTNRNVCDNCRRPLDDSAHNELSTYGSYCIGDEYSSIQAKLEQLEWAWNDVEALRDRIFELEMNSGGVVPSSDARSSDLSHNDNEYNDLSYGSRSITLSQTGYSEPQYYNQNAGDESAVISNRHLAIMQAFFDNSIRDSCGLPLVDYSQRTDHKIAPSVNHRAETMLNTASTRSPQTLSPSENNRYPDTTGLIDISDTREEEEPHDISFGPAYGQEDSSEMDELVSVDDPTLQLTIDTNLVRVPSDSSLSDLESENPPISLGAVGGAKDEDEGNCLDSLLGDTPLSPNFPELCSTVLSPATDQSPTFSFDISLNSSTDSNSCDSGTMD